MRGIGKSRLVRFAAIVLCVALFAAVSVSAETLDEIRGIQADLQAQIAEKDAVLNDLRNDEAEKQAYKQTLEENITLTQQRIEEARKNIEALNADITVLEEKLEESEAEYVGSMELLKKRIKAIYQTGDVGTVEILLNATSLYDFSLKSELLKSFTEHDKQLLSEIQAFMEKTAEDRNALQERKNEVAELKKQQEADQVRLEGLMAENNQAIADLQVMQSNTAAERSNLEQEEAGWEAEAQAMIEAERQRLAAIEAERLRLEEEARQNAANSGGSGNSGSSGGSIDTGAPSGGDGSGMSEGFSPRWPLPGYDTSWITCWYGEGGHNGLDIAGNYGSPIVAAQSGNVISAEYHWSWGNNVFIYHNGSYSTRYAHMSSMAVSAGQYVERGQTIGYVGDTGYSFGNHLHFEVYLNGSRVDPYPYL